MENNFQKAYTEVLVILNHMSKEDINKIPQNVINGFELNKDKNHHFEINSEKPLEEQDILEETKDILSVLFRDYWASQEQKNKILAKENHDRMISEEEKRKKFDVNDLFKTNDTHSDNTEEIITIKEKWYDKFIKFFKRIFRK